LKRRDEDGAAHGGRHLGLRDKAMRDHRRDAPDWQPHGDELHETRCDLQAGQCTAGERPPADARRVASVAQLASAPARQTVPWHRPFAHAGAPGTR
jgi:hypothetical protein